MSDFFSGWCKPTSAPPTPTLHTTGVHTSSSQTDPPKFILTGKMGSEGFLRDDPNPRLPQFHGSGWPQQPLIPSFACNIEGLPKHVRSTLRLCSPWFHSGGPGQPCVPSERERPTEVLHVALRAVGGQGGRAQQQGRLPSWHANLCRAPDALPALLSPPQRGCVEAFLSLSLLGSRSSTSCFTPTR